MADYEWVDNKIKIGNRTEDEKKWRAIISARRFGNAKDAEATRLEKILKDALAHKPKAQKAPPVEKDKGEKPKEESKAEKPAVKGERKEESKPPRIEALKQVKRDGKPLIQPLALPHKLAGYLTNMRSAEPGFKTLFDEIVDKNTTDAPFADPSGRRYFAAAFLNLMQNRAFYAFIENNSRYAALIDPFYSKDTPYSKQEALVANRPAVELAKEAMREFLTSEKSKQPSFVSRATSGFSDTSLAILRKELPADFKGDKNLALAVLMYARRVANPNADLMVATKAETPRVVEQPKGTTKGTEVKKDEPQPETRFIGPPAPAKVELKPQQQILFVGMKHDSVTAVYADTLHKAFESATDATKRKEEKVTSKHVELTNVQAALELVRSAPKDSKTTIVFVVTARDFFSSDGRTPRDPTEVKKFTDGLTELAKKAKEKGVELLVVPALYGNTMGYTEEKLKAVVDGNAALPQPRLDVSKLVDDGKLKVAYSILSPNPVVGGMPKSAGTTELASLLANHFKLQPTQTRPIQTTPPTTDKTPGDETYRIPR